MEHKNIPIYKNENKGNSPVANDSFAKKFNMTPILLDGVVVGFVSEAKYDGVDQILGTLWLLDSIFENEEVEYSINTIECQFSDSREFIPVSVHLERIEEPKQLSMEDI